MRSHGSFLLLTLLATSRATSLPKSVFTKKEPNTRSLDRVIHSFDREHLKKSHHELPKEATQRNTFRKMLREAGGGRHAVGEAEAKYIVADATHKFMGRLKEANREQKPSKMHAQSASLERGASMCGKTIKMPLKRSALEKKIFGRKMMLLQEPEPGQMPEAPLSWSHPGAGAVQKLADNGLSEAGEVYNSNLDEMQEVNVKIYKDAYSPVGCFNDAMLKSGDKFSNGANEYKESLPNVSIAVYKELVLEEDHKEMTPEVCYDFCRTVPDMVFFGIADGRDCYCTPFYQKAAGSDAKCDSPCPGDTTQTCGGKGRSGIWEMHMCMDTLADFMGVAVDTADALLLYYGTIMFTNTIAEDLQRSTQNLHVTAGLGGDPVARDLAQLGKVWAGEVEKSMFQNRCMKKYQELIAIYEGASDIPETDLSLAVNVERADTAQQEMKRLIPEVAACTAVCQDHNLRTYPYYFDLLEATSDAALQAKLNTFTTKAMPLYYPILYFVERSMNPQMSTCNGKMVGEPMLLTMPECAEACDRHVYPIKCVGFQFFHLGGKQTGGGVYRPMCYLFQEFTEVTRYTCAFMEAGGSESLELFTNSSKLVTIAPEVENATVSKPAVAKPAQPTLKNAPTVPRVLVDAKVLAEANISMGEPKGATMPGDNGGIVPRMALTYGSIIGLRTMSPDIKQSVGGILQTCGWDSGSEGYTSRCNEHGRNVGVLGKRTSRSASSRGPSEFVAEPSTDAPSYGHNSAQWVVLGNGKTEGEPVLYGDEIYLKNRRNLPTRCQDHSCSEHGRQCSQPAYLGTCGTSIEDADANKLGNNVCATEKRGSDSTWRILGDTEGAYVLPSIALTLESLATDKNYLSVEGSSFSCSEVSMPGMNVGAIDTEAASARRSMSESGKALWQWIPLDLIPSAMPPTPDDCNKIQRFVFYSGLSCTEIWGADSEVHRSCPKVCEKSVGAMVSAVCNVKFAAFNNAKPDVKMRTNDRCFGGVDNSVGEEGVDDIDVFVLQVGEEGVVFQGDVEVAGGEDLRAPSVWTS